MNKKNTQPKQAVKVLHIIESLEGGGAQRIIYQLCVRADRSVIVPVVCAIHEGGTYEQAFRAAGVELEPLYMPRRSIRQVWRFATDIVRIFYRLAAIIRKHNIDLLHAHLPDGSMLAVALGLLLKKPVILTLHNTITRPTRKAPLRDRLRRVAHRGLFRRATHLIAVGNDVRDVHIAMLGADIPITTIFNGVDLARFDGMTDTGALRAELGLQNGACVVLTAARLEIQKGHAVLLQAVAELARRNVNIELLVAGTGSLELDLKAEAQSLGIDGRVHFLGHRSDMERLLGCADLFVLPSFYEGIPVAVLEAMAAGKAVVATRIQGTQELIDDGCEGLLVEPRNVSELASALERLAADAETRAAMGLRGKQKVIQNFSLEKMVGDTTALYLRVLRGTAY